MDFPMHYVKIHLLCRWILGSEARGEVHTATSKRRTVCVKPSLSEARGWALVLRTSNRRVEPGWFHPPGPSPKSICYADGFWGAAAKGWAEPWPTQNPFSLKWIFPLQIHSLSILGWWIY